MDSKDLLTSLVALIPSIPIYVVWIIGVVLAVSRRRKHPQVSRIVITVLVLMLITSIIGSLVGVWLPLTLSDRGFSTTRIGLILAAINLPQMLINLVLWIFLLAAIFGWRQKSPTEGVEAAEAGYTQPVEKQRHGCLTAHLSFIIIANVLVGLYYLLTLSSIRAEYAWIYWAFIFLSFVQVALAIALFEWQKWGFYGFIVTTTLAFIINIYVAFKVYNTLIFSTALTGFVGVAVLYGVLQIGDKNKGWPQLA